MRMAIWHAGNTMSNILSGFLAAAILENMKGTLGLHAWQWFFIIEGAASILVAIAGFFLLPSWPHNTKWMTTEESEMAQYRVMVSNGGQYEEVGGTWDGVKDAAKDPFTWCFCLMHFALVTAQSFKDFMPSVSVVLKLSSCLESNKITDHGNLWLQQAHHLSRTGTPLRHRLCIRLRHGLHIWSLPRIFLAHCCPNFLLRCRFQYADWHSQRWRPLLWSHPAHLRHLLRPQLAAVLGDYACPCAP